MSKTAKSGKYSFYPHFYFIEKKKIYINFSVLGELTADQLGKTLTHEHVSMEFIFSYKAPKASQLNMVNCEWDMCNSGWIQQWP